MLVFIIASGLKHVLMRFYNGEGTFWLGGSQDIALCFLFHFMYRLSGPVNSYRATVFSVEHS
jgi:hypothetical protein